MTRKDGRGIEKPLSMDEVSEEIKKYLDSEHISMIYPTSSTWSLILDSLLKQHAVSGADIHDLLLIATMLSNGVKKIYTFNTKDFVPFSEIEVLNPNDVIEVEDESLEEDSSLD